MARLVAKLTALLVSLVLTGAGQERASAERPRVSAERSRVSAERSRAADRRAIPQRARGGAPLRPFVKAPSLRRSRKLADDEIVRIQGQPFLARTDYRDLKGATLELLRRYRPDRHFFLALGRDPAPITAFLQNLGGPNLAVNFTASGKGWPASRREWANYFRALVPEHVWQSGRDIVLIDQTNAGSGRTLALFQPIMQEYLDSIGSKARVIMVGFSTGALTGGVKLLDVSPYPDVNRYLYSPYEGVVSEYDRHVPGQQRLDEVAPRPEYGQYRAAVMARMQEDRTLRDEVARLPGAATLFRPPVAAFRRRPARVAPGLGTPLPAGDYAAMRDLGVQTLRRFSPRDHFFLGVGQGSTTLVAFLQNAGGPDLARYLPADDVGKTMKPAWRAAYAHALRTILPSDVVWGFRKLVLVHPAESEYTLARLQEVVTDALPHARVTVAGVGTERLRSFPTLTISGAEREPLFRAYRDRSPFDRFRIGQDAPEALRSNRAFGRFRRELGNHMAGDRALQELLDEL